MPVRNIEGLRPLFLKACREIDLPEVEQREHGILAIEALALLAWSKVFHVKHIIESGVCNGRSTTYLKKSGFYVTSVDRRDLNCDADIFICADSQEVLPKIVNGEAVFIDGPKGEKAYNLAQRIKDKAAFVAIHDVYKPDREKGFEWVSSHDEAFLEEFSHLLDNPNYPKGPGLGVLWS